MGDFQLAQWNAQPNFNYETLRNEAVDEGLSLLGDSGKNALYFYLEKDYNIKKGDVCSKVKDFSDALDKTFGVGSVFIKTLIIKNYFQKINMPLQENQDAARFVELLSPKN